MRLATTRIGSGNRAAILLHGYLGSGRNLATLARAWATADPSRTLVLMDLTGHGQSPPPPLDASLETLARDVLDTAQAEGLAAPYIIVGHSLGGRVGLQAKLLDPARVRHVTLLDIAPGPIGEAGDEQTDLVAALVEAPATFTDRESARQSLLSRGVSRPLTEWLLTNLVPEGEGYRWRIDRAALKAIRPRINAADLWPAVEQYGASIRCIRGRRSRYVTDEDAARMERYGCQVETLDAGHYVHVDQPGALVELLLSTPG